MPKSIKGSVLKRMFISGAKLIEINKEHVDQLNVFPVPDGDTGTNMSLTMLASAKEVAAVVSNDVLEICEAATKGALRGARGNSGVILSQIIKGFCSELSEVREVTTKRLSKALLAGTTIAYTAVTKPQEGTILTVIKAISEAAMRACKRTSHIGEFFEEIMLVGEETLKLTPEMLPVLKKAGVVDAGGRGLLVILQGFYNALMDKAEGKVLLFNDSFTSDTGEDSDHFDILALEDIEFAYCTEFFITNLKGKTTEADIDKLRESLLTIGDSVIVVGDLSFIKVHVHTNEPGIVLTYALELGEVDKIKIENMLQQNRDLIEKRKEKLVPFGLVAIAAGEGLVNIFKDLMVDIVVEGGQTMNPSAADIASACEMVAAQTIFVFPNNKNIILAAEQAKALTNRTIHVIPTKSIPQGISSILAFDSEASIEDNVKAMHEAIGSVRSGAVTYAVRSTVIDGLELKEGDIIGIESSKILSKGESAAAVCSELVESMITEDTANITLYYGNNIKEKDAEKVQSALADKYSFCEVDILEGGQPLYYYIVSLE